MLLVSSAKLFAQDGYKTPPKDIMDLVLVKPTPNVSLDDKAEWMLFTQSNSYPSVEELARPELRIAGLRINPNNFAPSRQTFINDLWFKNLSSDKEFKISGLPSPLMAGNINWSPNDKKIAFTHTTSTRVDLYVIDVATQKATKVNKQALNTISGGYQWIDDNTLLYRTIVKPVSAAPPKSAMPKGPTLQENYGKASPRPTFQDMIKNPYDEQLYEFYGTTQLVKNVNGAETKIGAPAIYTSINVSPDKKYMMLRTIKKPFSYTRTCIWFSFHCCYYRYEWQTNKTCWPIFLQQKLLQVAMIMYKMLQEVLTGEMMKPQLLFGACRLIVV